MTSNFCNFLNPNGGEELSCKNCPVRERVSGNENDPYMVSVL